MTASGMTTPAGTLMRGSTFTRIELSGRVKESSRQTDSGLGSCPGGALSPAQRLSRRSPHAHGGSGGFTRAVARGMGRVLKITRITFPPFGQYDLGLVPETESHEDHSEPVVGVMQVESF